MDADEQRLAGSLQSGRVVRIHSVRTKQREEQPQSDMAIVAARDAKTVQGLKPTEHLARFGTTKVVP
jgi:hypothetical protein